MTEEFQPCGDCYTPDLCYNYGRKSEVCGYPLVRMEKPERPLDPIALQKRIAKLEQDRDRMWEALSWWTRDVLGQTFEEWVAEGCRIARAALGEGGVV